MAWKYRGLAMLLAVLMLCAGLSGCQGGPSLPGVGQEITGPEAGEQTTPAGTGEAQVETLPVPTLSPELQLTAVQCYYEGVLQREYTLSYDENGLLTMLVVYTYDEGQLYSWGQYAYTYDDRQNLISNVYTHTLGSQSWEYENSYTADGVLSGYKVTEHYNEKLAGEYDVSCAYDDQGRYMGTKPDAEATFDTAGRLLTLRTLEVRDDYRADTRTEYDYGCPPAVICHTHTVFPEYEQFSSGLRLMLNSYHPVFELTMKDGYRTVTDASGALAKVVDENGADVYLFLYN